MKIFRTFFSKGSKQDLGHVCHVGLHWYQRLVGTHYFQPEKQTISYFLDLGGEKVSKIKKVQHWYLPQNESLSMKALSYHWLIRVMCLVWQIDMLDLTVWNPLDPDTHISVLVPLSIRELLRDLAVRRIWKPSDWWWSQHFLISVSGPGIHL